MTLPEHIICSVMLAQFGVRQRCGWRGVTAVALAGIAPDVDTAVKLVDAHAYWRLHHALGHSLISILILSVVVATAVRLIWSLKPTWFLWLWCFVAAAAHVFTDAIYWWGVQVFWPFGRWELKLNWIEYLDLLVLVVWLAGAFSLYRLPGRAIAIASLTLGVFAVYLAIRAALPKPTEGSLLHWITGGWMYAAPRGTPVLDWW